MKFGLFKSKSDGSLHIQAYNPRELPYMEGYSDVRKAIRAMGNCREPVQIGDTGKTVVPADVNFPPLNQDLSRR